MAKKCEHGSSYEEVCARCQVTWHTFLLNVHRNSAEREQQELSKWQAAAKLERA